VGKKVSEAMSAEPTTVKRSTAVRHAAELMSREDVGSLPVVEETGELVGIVTDRDIVVRVVAAGNDIDAVEVGEILTAQPVSVSPDDPLDDAMERMAYYRVRRLPVVIDMQLVGVLAQADVAQEAKDKQAGQVLEAISQDSSDQAESVGARARG